MMMCFCLWEDSAVAYVVVGQLYRESPQLGDPSHSGPSIAVQSRVQDDRHLAE